MENNRLLAAFAYLGWFVTGMVLLVGVKKENDFVRFHAMQSILVFGGVFISLIILLFIPIVGWIVEYFVGLFSFILWVFLLWKAISGDRYKVPVIGDMAEKQLEKIS